MCIFKRKSMYRYKMFERFRINIDKVIELQNENEAEYCKLIGSTDRFNLYLYKVNKNDSNGYLLRQDKINVKKVVYFGMAKNNICLFNDKVYMIDRISRVGYTYHPLFGMDIEDGTMVEYKLLSDKECYIVGNSFHIHCQDFVESLYVKNDVMMLHISRYKEKTNYEKESEYDIQLNCDNGKIIAKYLY